MLLLAFCIELWEFTKNSDNRYDVHFREAVDLCFQHEA